ncbi:MAG: hypothetical protein ABJP45_06830, partial [Cyclobacteriaceae bacterium]
MVDCGIDHIATGHLCILKYSSIAMSAGYTSILWNSEKKKYDRGILIFVVVYLVSFYGLHAILHPEATFETLLIRAFGILAFFLLHVILVIGPISRLNAAFLPLLYN